MQEKRGSNPFNLLSIRESLMGKKGKPKQIGTLTAIIIVIGTTIGAGIFLKNSSVLKDTSGSFLFAILAWVLAAIGAISMALSLIEVVSAQKGNGSVLEWVRQFTKPSIYLIARGFMLYVFYPIIFVTIPVYLCSTIETAASIRFQWWHITLIVLGVFLWLSTLSFVSVRFSTSIQWVLTVVKFAPILLVPILGFINANSEVVDSYKVGQIKGLTGLAPFLGTILAIPAVFFAFDGFYTVTPLRSSMKKPNKLGLVLAIGIGITTFVYLLIAISVFLASREGTAGSILPFKTNPQLLKRVLNAVNIFIVLAVLGVCNGFSLGSYRVYDADLSLQSSKNIWNRLKFWKFSPGWIMLSSLTILYLIFIAVFGTFLFDNDAIFGSGSTTIPKYSRNFYGFVDVITNWNSLIMFFMITLSILGCLINRKTKKVEVVRSKYFVPFALITLFMVWIPVIYMIVEPVVNLFGVNGASWKVNLVYLIALLLTVLISCMPLIWFKLRQTNRFNRIFNLS